MDVENKDTNPTPNPEPAVSTTDTPAPAANPTFTPEQMSDIFARSIAKVNQENAEKIQEAIRPQPQPPQQVYVPAADEIAKAYEDGDFRKGAQLQEQRDYGLRTQYEQGVIAPLWNQNISSMNSMVMQSIKAEPHYAAYKDEIDAVIKKSFHPSAPLNMEIVRAAYDLVVGRHSKDIIDRERESAIRATRESMPASTPTGHGGMPTPNQSLPPIEEIFGNRAVNRMKDKARSVRRGYDRNPADEEAYRQGYRTGYAEMVKDYQGMQKELEDNSSLGLDK